MRSALRNSGSVTMTTIGSSKPKVSGEQAFYDAPVPRPTGLGVRHQVLGMAILLGSVTYLDRVAMSVLRGPITQEFGLSDVEDRKSVV